MQLTVDTICAVTKINLDTTAANNIWIPAVKQEIETRCNRSFIGDDGSHTPQSGVLSWVRYEIPVGNVDGVNTEFTLSQTPQPNKVEVYVDGQLVLPNVDYTIDEDVITFASAPVGGSEHPIWVNFLPLGLPDDEDESQEPEYPYDLGVAACWHTVIIANADPLTAVTDGNIKSESTGSLRVEYFADSDTAKQKIEDNWAAILTRYRKPAICDSSQTQSQSMASNW